MRLVTVLACIAAVLSCAWAEDVVCKKRTKTSVQVGDGESFSFKTQAGREYKPNSRCIVKYKKSSSCPSMRFSCSKFSLKARNPSCTKGGDKMLVVMDGKKANRFCQGNPPNMTTTGDMQIVFISNRASQSSGAECSVECVSGQDGTPGNTGPVSIQWFYGMNIVHKCVSPGTKVTFRWPSGHNVNEMTEPEFKACNVAGKNNMGESGPLPLPPAPSQTGNYYFACGVPGHCLNGNMKAKIVVSDDCVKVANDYRQLYSGVAGIHTKMASLLTQEQIDNLSLVVPVPCDPHCKMPNFCWHGACICPGCQDDQNLAPGKVSTYLESVEEMTTVWSKHQVKGFVNWSGCSPTLESCVSNCLAQVLKAFAECAFYPKQHECMKKFLGAGSTCLSCICELIKHVFNISVCHDEPKPISYDCDRDCATSQPLTCVFNFTVEMLRTETDGRRADGRPRSVLAYNGKTPGPPIVICKGDVLVVNFKNRISRNMTNAEGSVSTSTLHFHGIREKSRPWSDGVPFVTQSPVISGDDFSYGFNSLVDGAPPGTYWYHSHVGSQRTNGAYGALIIKDSGTDPKDRFDVDNATNTLVLQEWYESSTKQTPVSLLINGKGRVGERKLKVVDGDDESEITLDYLKGKGGRFECAPNEDHNPDNYTTNYEEFDVEANSKYRFRVIGAISQNFPLRLSIDDHKFTAIAMDSLNIEPVPNLTDLWLAAGERYDIVVQTKADYKSGPAYKIRVFGYTNQYNKSAGSLCTIAWLKYPNQDIDYSYVTTCDCSGFELPSPRRTLNPVPNNITEWKDSPANGNYFIKDLRATEQVSTIDVFGLANLNTHYIEFGGEIAFNGLRMTYPDVPFLLQDPANKTDRCGSECDFYFKDFIPHSDCTQMNPTSSDAESDVECQHVLKQPWAPDYWAEIVLINNHWAEWQTAAHPIHQHGGWYWVVGEGMYNHTINRTWIMNQDQNHTLPQNFNCTIGKNCLPRNFHFSPAKDTIQVPPQGYVILRTPLDNAGTWIFHCHINYHVTIGMAMVLQIGGLGEPKAKAQDWCTGPLMRNEASKTPPPSPGGGTTSIDWFYGMEPKTTRCVAPGMNVTFLWEYGHTVDQRSKEMYEKCILEGGNHKPTSGNYVWTASALGDHYFACGLDYNKTSKIGGHCKKGNMNAHILVSKSCNSPSPPPPPAGGSISIHWYYGMDPNTTKCVAPGKTVTFNWQSGHNVNQISKEAYGTGNTRECNLKGKDHGSTNGPYHWTAPAVGDYYFACGLHYDSKTYIGGHCKNGNMNAHILVSNSCK